MGPAFYVIAIMGCADGSAACTPVQTMSTRYESREACLAASNDALMAAGDADYPTVIAQCRPSKAPAAQKTAPDKSVPTARQG